MNYALLLEVLDSEIAVSIDDTAIKQNRAYYTKHAQHRCQAAKAVRRLGDLSIMRDTFATQASALCLANLS